MWLPLVKTIVPTGVLITRAASITNLILPMAHVSFIQIAAWVTNNLGAAASPANIYFSIALQNETYIDL